MQALTRHTPSQSQSSSSNISASIGNQTSRTEHTRQQHVENNIGNNITTTPLLVISIYEKEKTKELLSVCVALRDYILVDGHIPPELLQAFELCKCQLMFKQHNLMEFLISELYRLRGYERTPELLNTNLNANLNSLYNDVIQALRELKDEIMRLGPVFENAKRLHLRDRYSDIMEFSESIFSRNQTPVEQSFYEFANLAEKLTLLNKEIIEPMINKITIHTS